MRLSLLLFISSMTCAGAFAATVYQVGNQVDNLCWMDVGSRNVCLEDAAGNVRVLLFSTGWCGPCNQEFQELVPRVTEFDGKPVSFIGILGEGFSHGQKPDPDFLQAWRDKFNIPFVVAGAHRDFGQKFGNAGLPNVAIIDFQGKLAYKATMPGVAAIFSQVNELLRQPHE